MHEADDLILKISQSMKLVLFKCLIHGIIVLHHFTLFVRWPYGNYWRPNMMDFSARVAGCIFLNYGSHEGLSPIPMHFRSKSSHINF
jgi:hypothetical protein